MVEIDNLIGQKRQREFDRKFPSVVEAKIVFDIEVYKDYFLAMFRNTQTGRTRWFELYDGHDFDIKTVGNIIKSCQLVSFNGINFDIPILMLALKGATNAELKEACDAIIVGGLRSWHIEQRFNVRIPKNINHIDLINVAPGIASLKIYGGRLHCQKMQDLPIEPNASISSEQREELKTYCGNDLETTFALYKKLEPQIELREKMGKLYGEDLRSKSDAQIAETVIKKQLEQLTGEKPYRIDIASGTKFRYKAPKYVYFNSILLLKTLVMIENAVFIVNIDGKVIEPDEFKKATIKIGNSVYRLGIGGLHSSEKSVSYRTDNATLIVDRDVSSYYPAIILQSKYAPKHLGDPFLDVYKTIVDKRLEAKKSGDKVTSDSLKITINGSFGKFGNKWSALFSPDLLIQTTITGQLSLLMLIENLEDEGIPVVSANTDGVVIKCPMNLKHVMEKVVKEWEIATKFLTEATYYEGIYCRDVNNYIAIKNNGEVKTKGAYADAGLSKNPTNEICTQAVINYLKNKTPIEVTVNNCRDITKFVTIRQVKGGAIDQNGGYLGKAVRWYYSTKVEGAIRYKGNNNKVARSDGAQALMEIPSLLPDDINFAWYISEAKSILKDIGY